MGKIKNHFEKNKQLYIGIGVGVGISVKNMLYNEKYHLRSSALQKVDHSLCESL